MTSKTLQRPRSKKIYCSFVNISAADLAIAGVPSQSVRAGLAHGSLLLAFACFSSFLTLSPFCRIRKGKPRKRRRRAQRLPLKRHRCGLIKQSYGQRQISNGSGTSRFYAFFSFFGVSLCTTRECRQGGFSFGAYWGGKVGVCRSPNLLASKQHGLVALTC